jgi:hypothetical protein
MTDLAEGSVVETPAGNPATPPPAVDNGSATEGAKSWFDGLSEGNRKIAEAKGWTKPESSIDKVLTSYAELERQQGESLRVPAPDAPKEEWDKFHSKLPGVSPKAAQAYHDKFVGFMADQMKAQQVAVAQSVEKTHDDLVKDWGPATSDGFKEKLEVANRAMKNLGLVDAYKAKGILLADGSLTDPQIAKAFHAVGEAMFKEDKIGADGVQGGENPFKKDAKGERNISAISALYQKDPERAKRMAREAGEDPNVWFPNNPR